MKVDEESYDIKIELNLTRRQTNATKELLKDKNHYRFIPSKVVFDYLPSKIKKGDTTVFYKLSFRIVRFSITDDTFETLITNLPAGEYSAS